MRKNANRTTMGPEMMPSILSIGASGAQRVSFSTSREHTGWSKGGRGAGNEGDVRGKRRRRVRQEAQTRPDRRCPGRSRPPSPSPLRSSSRSSIGIVTDRLPGSHCRSAHSSTTKDYQCREARSNRALHATDSKLLRCNHRPVRTST